MDPVQSYISKFPEPVQELMQTIRRIILEEAPSASEMISYGMPGYKMNGKPLVYFAAYTHHIGFYATPQGHEAFAGELSSYKQGKGSVQFPLDKPIPFDLIRRIVAFKVRKNQG